tara:strand:- start:368 stop:607 length:240 start_codon:yes stop_codon:yes gene_type:complete
MQLQELKMLVEYEAVGSLIATRVKGGWVLAVTKKIINKDEDKSNNLLDLARGGTRMFKTLDALAKLVKTDLYSSTFTVC